MISQEKSFSCYILLTDPILLSDCLYFFRYWAICVLQMFVSQADIIKFEINLIFILKPFRYMSKKSRQKLKHLENEKSCCGEIKSIFHLFKSAFSCQKLSQTWECSIKICRMCVVNSSVKILNYY